MAGIVSRVIKVHSFLLATAVVLFVYILILWWLPKDVFWSPDEGSKLLNMHTISWADGVRFTVPYNGRFLDPDFQFYVRNYIYPQPSSACNIRFNWPLWFPLLSLIPYRLFGVWGLYLAPLLAGWGTAVLSGIIARRIQPKADAATVLVVGLATPILFYSVLFWEHTIAVFLALFALWLLVEWPYRSVKWPSFLGIGSALLLSTALRSEASVFALSLLLAFILTLFLQRKGVSTWSWLKREAWLYKWHYLLSGMLLTAVGWLLFIVAPPQENTPSSYCKTNRFEGTVAALIDQVESVANKTIERGKIQFSLSVGSIGEVSNWNSLFFLPVLLLIAVSIGIVLLFIRTFIKKNIKNLLWGTGAALVAVFIAITLFTDQAEGIVNQIVKLGETQFSLPANNFAEMNNWNNLPHLINRIIVSEDIHPPVLLLVMVSIGILLLLIGTFTKGNIQSLLWVVGVLLVAVFVASVLFYEQRYRYVRSIFLPASYLLLVVYYRWQKQLYAGRIIAFTTFLYFFIGLTVTLWHEYPGVLAGLEWGSRYMLNFYPVATIATVVMLTNIYEKTVGEKEKSYQTMLGSALILIVLSILFNGRGVNELSSTKTGFREQQTALLTAIDAPIVSDSILLPSDMPLYYLDHDVYIIENLDEFQRWVALAAPQNEKFYYFSFYESPSLPESSDYILEIKSTRLVHKMILTEIEIISQ